jgi:type IV pilus assembly protein PilW
MMFRRFQSEAGFSIISLLIASALGIFLIGGAIKVYVDSKNTFNTRSAVATATENLRFAIQDLRRTLVMAGRGVEQRFDDLSAYSSPDNLNRTFPNTGSFVNLDVDANGSSVIAVRYADGPAPCGQNNILVNTVNTVRFFISNTGNLVCAVDETNYSEPLVSGIITMRALYGLDGNDVDTTADRYLSAAEMTPQDWNYVVSIRIGLIGSSGDSSPLPPIYRPSNPETIDLLGLDVTAPNTEHFFKSASTTISFRNRNGIVSRQ